MSNGIVNEPSNHSVDETVDKLKAIVQASGAVLFRLVDHSGEVEKVGLEMKPTKLLIYGNPNAGTPLMLASPSTAIDLPLKMLVWEDAAKKGGFSTAQNLLKRHGFPEDLLPNVSVLRKLASGAAR
jgi:uncharacterized protein (DUF302 family)